MSIIRIDPQTCTKCNACAESCPILLFDAAEENTIPSIPEINDSRCIHCGHCEAVCPTRALTHQHTTEDLLIPDKSLGLNADDIGLYFKSRRSIRKFKSRAIEKATIEKMMEVVRYAPTGTNRQLNKWVVISDKSLIRKLAAATIDWMRAAVKGNPEMAARMNLPLLIASFDAGNDRICRDAPHLFITYTPASYPLGAKDAVIAATQLELLMPSYGIGGCWAGYLMVAFQQYSDIKKLIGLDETDAVHAILMAGYPKFKYHGIPQRKVSDIKWL